MSSAFDNFNSSVDVSNRMFWRLHDFAIEIAETKADTPPDFLNNFKSIKESHGVTPDVDIDTFFSYEELKFWSEIFLELAQLIYDREIGNQENQNWQVSTIWASFATYRLFVQSLNRPKFEANNG